MAINMFHIRALKEYWHWCSEAAKAGR